jgi:hypothetical protein
MSRCPGQSPTWVGAAPVDVPEIQRAEILELCQVNNLLHVPQPVALDEELGEAGQICREAQRLDAVVGEPQLF